MPQPRLTTTAPNRGGAWKVAPKPEEWCPKCKAIAAGKTEKITDGLLEIPATKPVTKKLAASKKAAPKAIPAKKAATK